jgi:AAA domain, putative AbiEii toxin, Type IV TA system
MDNPPRARPRFRFTPPRLEVEHFGPIKKADVQFGDITVFVGPQAAGKSLFLQLMKLIIDASHVKQEFKRAGVDWQGKFESFLDVYFGEGMHSLWSRRRTKVRFEGADIDIPEMVDSRTAKKSESLFFIPAQRVLAFRDGWPQAFTHYDAGVPFAVREFSEELRLMISGLGSAETLFPVPRRLKDEFRELLQKHIFPGFNLKVDAHRAQKRLVLSSSEKENGGLPFVVWSAGQREFVPLLLGLYWLMTGSGASRRKGIQWVVIEELEMGLHPRAIAVVMLMIFELAARGYKVCISTHSPQVLDAMWALKHLKANKASPEALLSVFDAPKTPPMLKLAKDVMMRTQRVHYFDRDSGITKDISSLDPYSEEEGAAGWGGLSEFSGRANDAVAHAVANSKP